MVDQPPKDADRSRQMSEEHERARALADVLRDQAERAERAREAEVRRERSVRARRGVLLAVWASVAYVWIGNPSWINVRPPAAPTLGEEAEALRLNVFLQTQQVEAYRLARGRLPYVLHQAGPPFPGMEYRRTDNRFYEIRGQSERIRLLYDSRESPLDFVRDATRLIVSGSAVEERSEQ